MAHRYLGPATSAFDLGAMLGRWSASGIGVLPWFAMRLLEERERWLLWLPVGLGVGIAVYFALPAEPPVWLGPLAVALLGVVLGRAARDRADHPLWFLATTALMAVTAGFVLAAIRTMLVTAPVLERRAAYTVEGDVLLVEERVRGRRFLLGQPVLEGVAPDATPVAVRISVRSAAPAVTPGDRIRVRALLMPPSPPSEPRGFDFARQAFFQQLGAVGYALGPLERVAAGREPGWRIALAKLRQEVAAEIDEAVPGPPGAVAVALITGLRGAIPDQVWRDMQVAGIAHLLAISGLHLGLVAGTLFFTMRLALALAPPLTLRLPTKKVAAGVALAGAFAYLLLTGATVPTQRAFIMTALMLIAVMVDRNPFSMRLVAWAALVVLINQPESLLGASFQMSFTAVVALIAVYETGIGRRPDHASGLDWRIALYVGGVALTTLVASAATTPLAMYHFGRVPTYGIAANLIAVPLTAFWIMPLGLLGVLLLPLGLGAPCFVLMGQGIELMLAVAATIAAWPGAAVHVPTPPPAALVATLLGGLWLCLWRTAWRRLGLLGVALGLLLTVLDRPPDVLIDARGAIVGVRLADGRLALAPWGRDRWITNGWLERMGQTAAAPWPAPGSGDADGLRCDALGCILVREGRRLALARRPEALEDDCRRVDVVVSYPRVERCPNGTSLIGPRALRRAGGIALRIDRAGIEITSVRETRGERPWTR